MHVGIVTPEYDKPYLMLKASVLSQQLHMSGIMPITIKIQNTCCQGFLNFYLDIIVIGSSMCGGCHYSLLVNTDLRCKCFQ